MCGINGIVFSDASGRAVERSILARMRDVIEHRGPDDFGEFVDGPVGLGHRRLSIVDVKHGHQPMFNSDDSMVIVYNGEIYNHAGHRPALEAKGYRFQTSCDTEAILHLYEEHGPRCVEFLRGMFAFAVWDRRDKKLFIARDRLGIKPLYYVFDDKGDLWFASEIKSLLAAGAVRPEINFAALPDQLANHGTSGEETLFKDVRRLLPGHTLTWQNGRIEIEKYWDVSFEPKPDPGELSDEKVVEEWLELFRESVKLRLMADVPLGMFLSGGIDSSAICAMMAGMVDEPIKTFSVGFREREANEFRYARMVAEAFQTDHHEITITPEQFFQKLPDLIWHEDEPLGFIASVPLFFVSRLAGRHVKVVLTGEGSDELLGGYGRYDKTLLLLKYGRRYESVVPGFLRNLIGRNVSRLPSGARLERTFLARSADLESLYFDNFAIFTRAMQEKLLTAETSEKIAESDPYRGLRDWLGQTDARDLLDRLLYVDSKTYLHELLMKQDQMSMAASIESRVPFLDHELVGFTARLPEKFKIRRRETKWILRRAMEGILPPEILTRQKMGFPVPIGDWLRNDFRHIVDEYVLGGRAMERGIFEPDFVRQLVRRHQAGEKHDERLWFLINFEMWNRRFIDAESPRARDEERVLAV
ncbi:MAG: asparagine synthase (glutamine-hydrolyzing) [Pyrinomonadaceae bacterium]